MNKIVAVWSGWAGGPGFSNFYWTGDATAAQMSAQAGAVRTFFSAITLCLPTPVSININSTSQVIDPITGDMSAEVPFTPTPASVAGAGGSTFAAPVGACVIWRTGAVVAGRALKGKTFLVPLASSAFDSDGTLLGSRLAEIRAAATDLANFSGAGASVLGVWHRPAAGGGGGSVADVTVATVSDRAAILRSR